MPLSEKTLLEMKAGAEALARHQNAQPLSDEYVLAMTRTQERYQWLMDKAREGKLFIEHKVRANSNIYDPDANLPPEKVIVVDTPKTGRVEFKDYGSQRVGAWPTEVMVAQIILALATVGDA